MPQRREHKENSTAGPVAAASGEIGPSPSGPPRRRMMGFTLVGLLVSVSIIGTLASILIPNCLCALEKARVSAAVSNMRQARDVVETYMIYYEDPPPTLEAAYEVVSKNSPVPDLYYCGDVSDANKGHGNDGCDRFDEDNPSGQMPANSTPGFEYLLRTPRDLGPRCQKIDYAWLSCCGGQPQMTYYEGWDPAGDVGSGGSAPGKSGDAPGKSGDKGKKA